MLSRENVWIHLMSGSRIMKSSYLNQKKISIENTPIRFDVIGINGDSITHVENAFEFVMTR